MRSSTCCSSVPSRAWRSARARGERGDHLVERTLEGAEFARGGDADLRRVVPGGHGASGSHQLSHGPHDRTLRDEPDERAEHQHGEAGRQHGVAPDGGEVCVDFRQGDADVDHAQHALLGRMRVACRRRARGFVVNGRHHAQYPVAAGRVGAVARARGQPLERAPGLVAAVALLGPLVDHRVDFGPVAREGDAALLVEEADAVDPRLVPDRVHHEIRTLAPVFEHVVIRAALDGLAEEGRAAPDLVEEVALLRLQEQEGGRADQQQGPRGDTRRQDDGQAVPPPHV